MELLLTSAIFQ